ncbi:hypothetical protein PG984_009005, partial [Apiospora sp. TS-2023a]
MADQGESRDNKDHSEAAPLETAEASLAAAGLLAQAEPAARHSHNTTDQGAVTAKLEAQPDPVSMGEQNVNNDSGNDLLVAADRSRSVSVSKLPQGHRSERAASDLSMPKSKSKLRSNFKFPTLKPRKRGRRATPRVASVASHSSGGHAPVRDTSDVPKLSRSPSRSSSYSADSDVRSMLNNIEKSGEAVTGLFQHVLDLGARIERLENLQSESQPKKSDPTSKKGDEANLKKEEEPPGRKFELTTKFFFRSELDPEEDFADFKSYPFVKALWDELDADLSKPKTEEQNVTFRSSSSDILQICMESPVIQDFFETLSDTVIYGEGLPAEKPEPTEIPPDGTITFRKPFRWLIQHHDLIEDKVKILQNEQALLQTDESKINKNNGPKHGHSTVTESGSHTAEEKNLKDSGASHSDEKSLHTVENSEMASKTPDLEHDLLAQLQHLLAFMEEHLSIQLQRFKDARTGKLESIQFQDLWMLFKPNDMIYAPVRPVSFDNMPTTRPGAPPRERMSSDCPQAYRVVAVLGGRPFAKPWKGERKNVFNVYSSLEIMTYYIDFNGSWYGTMHTTHTIMPFDGNKEIRSLEVYPLAYAPDPEVSVTLGGGPSAPGEASILEFLLKRGHEFLQLSEASHRFYDGLTIGQAKEEVRSYFQLAYRNSPGLAPRFSYPDWQDLEERYGTYPDTPEAISNFKRSSRSSKTVEINWYRSHQLKLTNKARVDQSDACNTYLQLSTGKPGAIDKVTEGMVKDGYIYLLPGMVHAFALRTRKWVSLYLSLVQTANDQADWDDLILQPGHKEMVRAAVETHTAGSRSTTSHVRRTTEVDIVRGKGKGCIILLHGEPGVGKTSTAECVAAFTKRPLFSITCGDIGYDPSDVERNIDKHFSLAQKWGCVVLLDEADVFLAKRSRDDVKRNGLVSVFLRTLEYYQGILFLTTNRVGSIDDAFRSRLHLTLYYPKLDYDQTLAIWEVNLRRLDDLNKKRVEYSQEPIDIQRRKIVKFAKSHWEQLSWNGRQIRNAFQTAVALAEFDANRADHDAATAKASDDKDEENKNKRAPIKPVISTKQFRTIAKASMQFDEYLYLTHGSSDMHTNAKKEQMRWDYDIADSNRLKRHGGNRGISLSDSSSDSVDDTESESSVSADSADSNDDDSDGSSSDSSEEDKKKKKKKKRGKKNSSSVKEK